MNENRIKIMMRSEWEAEGKARFGIDKKNWIFKCPNCNTLQSYDDWSRLTTLEPKEINQYIGFSCIGRVSKDMGCNWSLGGLFQIHKLEVIQLDGKKVPFFEFAKTKIPIKFQKEAKEAT